MDNERSMDEVPDTDAADVPETAIIVGKESLSITQMMQELTMWGEQLDRVGETLHGMAVADTYLDNGPIDSEDEELLEEQEDEEELRSDLLDELLQEEQEALLPEKVIESLIGIRELLLRLSEAGEASTEFQPGIRRETLAIQKYLRNTSDDTFKNAMNFVQKGLYEKFPYPWTASRNVLDMAYIRGFLTLLHENDVSIRLSTILAHGSLRSVEKKLHNASTVWSQLPADQQNPAERDDIASGKAMLNSRERWGVVQIALAEAFHDQFMFLLELGNYAPQKPFTALVERNCPTIVYPNQNAFLPTRGLSLCFLKPIHVLDPWDPQYAPGDSRKEAIIGWNTVPGSTTVIHIDPDTLKEVISSEDRVEALRSTLMAQYARVDMPNTIREQLLPHIVIDQATAEMLYGITHDTTKHAVTQTIDASTGAIKHVVWIPDDLETAPGIGDLRKLVMEALVADGFSNSITDHILPEAQLVYGAFPNLCVNLMTNTIELITSQGGRSVVASLYPNTISEGVKDSPNNDMDDDAYDYVM